jgi:hypothetical protein
MSHKVSSEPCWFWYQPRLRLKVRLTSDGYPWIRMGRQLVQCPTWICPVWVGPNYFTPHTDRRVGRIDVDIVRRPAAGLELTCITGQSVFLLARSWLREVEDLIDDSRIFIGEVRIDGSPLEDWVTIHERWAPVLFGSEGRGSWCPHCGHLHMSLWGRIYFAEPEIAGRPLMVNKHGLFVREDIVLDRKLRRPAGTLRPGRVRLQPTPRPAGGDPDGL